MDNQSLAHSKYNCTYHIVFIPKYRRKVMFGNLRREVGEAISKVCRMEGVTILKAATLPDHVHMYVSIPPKESVAKVVGRIKGKSALINFDRHPEYRVKYDRHFGARGYYRETVGNVNEATIIKYIADQYERDRMEGDAKK
ncbi:MAG: IS200/IS605 family transposase [Lachnospiraceae bacterium]|nr:IS200/IS605 family transposase [Lachnospiraceae bacterium]